jgi:flagellar capping protein FliD
MNETDETLEIPESNAILQTIENLSKKFDSLENRFDSFENRFDSLEKNVNTQFEVIREGIAYNSAAFDRMEAKFHDSRSDV